MARREHGARAAIELGEAGIAVKRAVLTTWSDIEAVEPDGDALVVRCKTRWLRIKTGGDLVEDARRYVLCRAIEARGLTDDLDVVIAYLRSPETDYRHAPPVDALRAVAKATILPKTLRDDAARALEMR